VEWFGTRGKKRIIYHQRDGRLGKMGGGQGWGRVFWGGGGKRVNCGGGGGVKKKFKRWVGGIT